MVIIIIIIIIIIIAHVGIRAGRERKPGDGEDRESFGGFKHRA